MRAGHTRESKAKEEKNATDAGKKKKKHTHTHTHTLEVTILEEVAKKILTHAYGWIAG